MLLLRRPLGERRVHLRKRRLREIDRRLGFLDKRIEHAVVVHPKQQRGDKVFFGATVAEGRGRRARHVHDRRRGQE